MSKCCIGATTPQPDETLAVPWRGSKKTPRGVPYPDKPIARADRDMPAPYSGAQPGIIHSIASHSHASALSDLPLLAHE